MEPATIGRWTPYSFFLISVTFCGSLLVIVQVQQESNHSDRRRTTWKGDKMRRPDRSAGKAKRRVMTDGFAAGTQRIAEADPPEGLPASACHPRRRGA